MVPPGYCKVALSTSKTLMINTHLLNTQAPQTVPQLARQLYPNPGCRSSSKNPLSSGESQWESSGPQVGPSRSLQVLR